MRVKEELKKLDVRPSKGRGQNFLLDEGVLQEIVRFGELSSGDSVVEIGPGLGALTKWLVPNLWGVIEIEEKFCNRLAVEYPNLKIFREDVRGFDFSKCPKDAVVYGNVPYSISTEILFHLIENHRYLDRAILLLQKEFVERMGASPGSKTYGVLSVGVQISCEVFLGAVVPGSSFHPRANVDSQVVKLRFREKPLVDESGFKDVNRVVRAAFHQRRKKILNSMTAAGIASRADLANALEKSGIDPNLRAEMVPIDQFIAMARTLYSRS